MEVLKEFRRGTFDAPPEDILIDAKVDELELPEKPDGASHVQVPQASQQDSSIYTVACDQSLISKDLERWMKGSVRVTPTYTKWQGSKPTVVQQSALATEVTPGNGLSLYILALVMPLLNIVLKIVNQWRRTHKAVLNVLELRVARMRRTCSRVRCNIRRAVHSQLTKEIFATAIDVVLVVYAIGFLILSIYQAAYY